jgi:hypothetical protein
MYKLSQNVRKYSTTPLVKVDEDGKETQVLFSPLKKVEGEAFLMEIANILNNKEDFIELLESIKCPKCKSRAVKYLQIFGGFDTAGWFCTSCQDFIGTTEKLLNKKS